MMRYVLVVLSHLVLFSCHDKEQSQLARSSNSSVLLGLLDMSESNTGFAYEDVENAHTSPPLTPQEITQKIIKNANLRFETQNLEKIGLHVLTALKKADGYVQNDKSGKNYN